MQCQKCISKCHAGCCGVVPFDRKFVAENKPVRKVLKVLDVGEFVVLETENMSCPYLNLDYSCSVYSKRPDVCRLYGNENNINLTCQWRDKNGRIRSRQERRQIERKIIKFIDNYKRKI